MTFRQRLLTALNGDRPDIMPWFADLTYWYHAEQMNGTLPAEYEGDEGFVKLHVDHGVGYYLGYAPVHVISYENVKTTREVYGEDVVTRWETPVGSIVGRNRVLPATASEAPVQWPVTTAEDLKVLRYIADSTRTVADHTRLNHLKQLCGDQGHPTVLPPRSPVSQMLAQWTGATNLTFLLADAPQQTTATLSALARAADAAYEIIVGCDTPFVELPDNLSGEVVTRLFERHQFDYYLRRVEQLHAAGKKVGTHLDGTVRGILPLLVRTGLDFIEAITPQPTGDVAIEDLRDLAGPDVVLFGGMPGAMFAPPFTRDDVRKHVASVIEHHWEQGRFILGVADQVPPDADMGLLPMIGELCRQLCE